MVKHPEVGDKNQELYIGVTVVGTINIEIGISLPIRVFT